MTVGKSPPCTMRQERLIVVAAVSIFTALSVGSPTEAQTVLGHPYRANTRHELTCERGQQCAWYVRRGSPNNLFEPVRLDSNVQEGPFPVDLDVLLNEETKGTYRCLCRRDEREMYKLRKEVYFYSAGQRFAHPNEVAVMKGEPLEVSACYLSFLPEAANLRIMTLVNEATGERQRKAIRNLCANFTVNVSQPGSYHFQVATGQYGNILSESFNVTVQDAVLPSDLPTQKPTSAGAGADGMIVAIAVPILFFTLTLLFGTVAFITCCVLKRRKRIAQNRIQENLAQHNVLVNGNQHNNGGVGNNPVPPLQDNGIPLEVRAPDNHEENNDAGDLLVPPAQDDGVDVPLEDIVNGNQLEGDNVGDLPVPPVQDDANVPLEVIVNGSHLDGDGVGDPSVPAVQGNDTNVPPEVIVNGSQLEVDNVGDLPVPALQGNDANVPPEVGVDANQQDNNDVIVNRNQLDDNDAGDHAPANYVPVLHELQGNGDLPYEVDDRHDEHGANFRLGVPIAVSNRLNERARFVGNCNTEANSWSMNEDVLDRTTEESILTSEEEENRHNPKQPIPEEKEQMPEECTDRNKQCRPVDAMQRKASTRSRGESIGWPSFSSPSRATSETNHSLVMRTGCVQTSREDGLSVPKPFNCAPDEVSQYLQ